MEGPPVPFKILGAVSPILAWTEGENGSRLPVSWTTESVPFANRERDWILRQLPSYSYDNVGDIVAGARAEHPKAGPGAVGQPPGPRLSPPGHYDLLAAFRTLYEYFFVWNGTELCVRDGCMEDLHELALRLPSGHFVRHGHARAVAEGVVSFEDALDLPELVTLLPGNSFGLRSIVRRGLSESHLHLKAVMSAEETWADNLLRPRGAWGIVGRTSADRRLLTLNFFAGRLLALAVWLSCGQTEAKLAVRPARLIELMDEIYFARSPHEEYWAIGALDRAIRQAISGFLPGPAEAAQTLRSGVSAEGSEERTRVGFSPPEEHPGGDVGSEGLLLQQAVPKKFRFLLRWLAPTVHWLRDARGGGGSGQLQEGQRERNRLVHQLHLAAHLRLVQLSAPAWGADGPEKAAAGTPEGQLPSKATSPSQGWLDSRRNFLHETFFRYLVCRTHHWQQATQQGRTTGLRHFREYYGSPHRRPAGVTAQQYADLVFDRLLEWRGLRVLEGRVAPPARPQDLVPWVRSYARPAIRRLQKFGLVVHFKKEDENREDRPLGGWSSDRPLPRLRWGRRRRVVRGEAVRLYRLLRRPIPVSPFVVGIDACNLELATPPEVFAPAFRFLRELPIALTGGGPYYAPFYGIDSAIRQLVGRRRLGMTYHVGEDFRHLLSGLRAIDEVVTFLAPKPGDRLGHGTALALEPKGWLERNGYQAVLSKLEWLDTLVWVHHFLGPGDDVVGELAIEDRIQRLSWEIYGTALREDYDPIGLDRDPPSGRSEAREDLARARTPSSRRSYAGKAEPRHRGLLDWDWSPLTLWDAWALRQLDPYSVDLRTLFRGRLELKAPEGFSEEGRRWYSIQRRAWHHLEKQIGSRNAFVLLGLYWISPKVRKEGAQVKTVDMRPQRGPWLELCRRVGQKMKRRIREHELVVEVNPSSNRIIGPMERYAQHHVFDLTLDAERHLLRDVRVSINTDNPAVCNTTLAHEYYLLGEVLMREGVAEAEVINWLEWLRRTGEEYNFARRMKKVEDDPDMGKLVGWLQRIRPTVLEARTRRDKLEAFWTWMHESWLRKQGFSPDESPSHPDSLDRILSLEARLRSQRAT